MSNSNISPIRHDDIRISGHVAADGRKTRGQEHSALTRVLIAGELFLLFRHFVQQHLNHNFRNSEISIFRQKVFCLSNTENRKYLKLTFWVIIFRILLEIDFHFHSLARFFVKSIFIVVLCQQFEGIYGFANAKYCDSSASL